MSCKFSQIAEAIGVSLPKNCDVEIDGAYCDSRLVKPGSLFICKGAHFKPEFLTSAIENGAIACIADESFGIKMTSVPLISTENIRQAQAIASKLAWGKPDEGMKVIGITGSKGKTTVANFVKQIIEVATGKKCGMIGTHRIFDGKNEIDSPNTTPDSPDLYRYLRAMKNNGCETCVMEISSQALKYDRVFGLDLDIGVITNIGIDHIAPIEHPSLSDYVQSKFKIAEITNCLLLNQKLVLCKETEPFIEEQLSSLAKIQDLRVEYYSRPETKIDLKMKGLVNQENAQCAIKIAEILGIDEKESRNAVEDVQVEGRFETTVSKDGKVIGVVDYAHTKDSFECFFESVKNEFRGAYIISYFGCSAGKALMRQRELPETAAKFSDFVVITSDEPFDEDPEEFAYKIAGNLPPNTPHEVIVDRDEACAFAFEKARQVLESGDAKRVVVCALAKGTENVCPCSKGDIEITPDTVLVPQKVKEYDESL